MSYVYRTMKSPVGTLTLVGSERGLAAVLWEDDDPTRAPGAPLEDLRHPLLRQAQQQLEEYFAGQRRSFAMSFAVIALLCGGLFGEFGERVLHYGTPFPFR